MEDSFNAETIQQHSDRRGIRNVDHTTYKQPSEIFTSLTKIITVRYVLSWDFYVCAAISEIFA